MASKALTIAAVVLLAAAARAQQPAGPAALLTPAAESGGPAPAAANIGCACTSIGVSGGAYVGGRVGCAAHLADEGDPSVFCYVADPSACALGAVNVSTIYVGAAYRACDPTADGTPQAAAAQTTMADVVAALPELSTFAAALNQSRVQELGLPGRLAAPGSNLTLFAPSNEAFADALAALNLTGVPALLSSPQLVPLLLLHVARGAYTPEALARTPLGAVLPTLSPSLFSNISAVRILRLVRQPGGGVAPIKIVLLGADVYDSSSSSGESTGAAAFPSFNTSNGVVYVLDSVIAMLPNVVEAADQEPNLNTFSRALSASGVGASLGDGCPSPSDGTCNVTGVTLLAPTDTAFLRLARAQNLTVDELLGSAQLNQIVQYHVSPATQTPAGSIDLSTPQSLPTLLPGANVTLAQQVRSVPAFSSALLGSVVRRQVVEVLQGGVPGNVAGLNRDRAIQAYNGLIIPIDNVLLPFPFSPANQTAGAPAAEAPPQAAVPPVEPTAAGNNY